MHESVRAKWEDFSRPFEGYVHSMYVDVKNLVTTAVGVLVDPVSLALQLPWKHEKTGALATEDEIRTAWSELKNHSGLAVNGKLVPLPKLHWKYAAKLNDLRLSDADIAAIVEKRLTANVAHLRKTFGEWDAFPADAQLGILSMAWACGPGFTRTFKNFTRAALTQDWIAAALSCKIRTDGNPGVAPRNVANELCFHNAATVLEQGLPIGELHWPNKVEPHKSTPENPRPWLTDEERERVRLAQVDDIAINRADFMRDLSGLESIPPGTDDEGGLDA